MHFLTIPPILITTCISSSDPFTNLNDPKKRLFHVLEGIEKWLEINPDLRLVLCDGSNFDFSPIIKIKFPNANIECLYHQNSIKEIIKQGKGYGEGEIVKFALSNSKFLAASDVFIKCTGKLWVTNFCNCLNEWNGKFMADAHFSNIFNFRSTKIEYVDTRFYIVEKQFYIENFLNEYLITGFQKNRSLENIFLNAVESLNLKNFIFSINPIICGVGGGSGEYYKNNLKRNIKKKFKKIFLKKHTLYQQYIFNDVQINSEL